MPSNLDRYKKDLDRLLAQGELLHFALIAESRSDDWKAHLKKLPPKERLQFKKLPAFGMDYQAWYSEAKSLIRQLLPDRLDDFVRHYEKPKSRKDITFENYRIEDGLQGLTVTRGLEKIKIVSPAASLPHVQQQLAIVVACKKRFESSLFDIRQLVQADLFDSELEAASELSKRGFVRAAGAVAGVVVEKHLATVCETHNITVSKRNPTIGDLNDLLKNGDVIDVAQWRFIQHLGDLRNLCDHDKKVEPTADQVSDLLQGVAKVIKTLF